MKGNNCNHYLIHLTKSSSPHKCIHLLATRQENVINYIPTSPQSHYITGKSSPLNCSTLQVPHESAFPPPLYISKVETNRSTTPYISSPPLHKLQY